MLAELNAVHPFREGNGRTQRAFVAQLAQAAGHDLDFSVISKERMIVASMAAHDQNDLGPMRRLFSDAIDPARRAALRETIDFLDRQQFPWNERYIATVKPGHPVEVTFAGVAGDHFMVRTGSQILIGNVADLPDPRPERGQAFTLDPTHALSAEPSEPRRTRRRSATPRSLTTIAGTSATMIQTKPERIGCPPSRRTKIRVCTSSKKPRKSGQPRYDRYTGQRIDDLALPLRQSAWSRRRPGPIALRLKLSRNGCYGKCRPREYRPGTRSREARVTGTLRRGQ